MPDKILHKRSYTPGSKPTTSNLDALGEIAINVNDGKAFLRKSGSGIDTISEFIVTNTINTGSITLSGSITTNELIVNADVFEFTGSVRVSGSITGSLLGTASFAISSSQATSASFAISSSQAISASFALSASWSPGSAQSATASYILSSGVDGPFGMNSILSASNAATASSADNFVIRADVFEFTGSVRVSGSITGSLFGTSSFAATASYALNVPPTASWAINALTASSADSFFIRNGATFSGSINQSGSLNINGTLTATTIVVQTITASVEFLTGSTKFGDSATGDTHQFTGSVSISGSLSVVGLTVASGSFTGSFLGRYSGSYTGSYTGSLTGSLLGTGSWATSASRAITASYADDSNLLDGLNSLAFLLTSSFNLYSSSINSFSGSILTYTASINAKTSSFATTGSNIFIGNQTITGSLTLSSSAALELLVIGDQTNTGSLRVTGSMALTGSLGILGAVSASSFTGSYTGSYTGSFTGRYTGSYTGSYSGSYTGSYTGSLTGALIGTASWAQSASQALTASYMVNAFIQGGNSFGSTALLGTNDARNLQFETNGIVRMTISGSNGNVGIGTATPSSSLHIDSTNPQGVIIGTRTGSIGTLQLANLGSVSPIASRIMFGTDGTGWQMRIAKNTAGTIADLITVQDNGNIGIGTLTPGQVLDVNGRIRIGSNSQTEMYSSGNRVVFRGQDIDNVAQMAAYGIFLPITGQSYNLYLAGSMQLGYSDSLGKIEIARGSSGAINYVSINSNGDSYFNGGNVGINTTTPYEKLEVAGAISATGISANNGSQGHATTLSVNGGTSYLQAVDWGAEFKPLIIDGKTISLQTGVGSTTTRLYVDNTGSVGIGNTAPSSKLEISGIVTAGSTTTTNGSIILQDSYTLGHLTNFGTNQSSGGPVLGYCVYPSSSTNVFASATTIGPIERSAFSMDGSFRWYTGAAQQFASIGASASLSQKMVLDNNGNLGINNTSPSYKLDVVGDARVNTGALGVNVAPNAADGRIDASNDIVAYSSDMRLKTNIQLLSNPLEKINKLSGFTYNWNDKAKELANYDTNESLVGVFAQEVQAVLPEAVKLAPFDNDGNNNSISGENYLTVQYEKIVPLLIEAIKEQQKQIDELKYLLQNK